MRCDLSRAMCRPRKCAASVKFDIISRKRQTLEMIESKSNPAWGQEITRPFSELQDYDIISVLLEDGRHFGVCARLHPGGDEVKRTFAVELQIASCCNEKWRCMDELGTCTSKDGVKDGMALGWEDLPLTLNWDKCPIQPVKRVYFLHRPGPFNNCREWSALRRHLTCYRSEIKAPSNE